MINLKNKAVLITGSSLGIGRETAYKFSKEGCKIVVTYYKDKNEGAAAANKCMELGASDALALQLNVMDDKSIKNCVRKAINNAGIIVWKKFKGQAYEDIENQISTNLTGLIKMTKECLPYVKDTIINVASGAGLDGYPELTTYCATKFGVRGFSQALAQELRNIKVYHKSRRYCY